MHGNSRNTLVTMLMANFAASQTPGKAFDGAMVTAKKMLDQGTLKLSDASIYSTKDASSTNRITLFETSDVEQKGVCNITAGKLALNQYVLIDSIALYAATSQATINKSAAVLGALDYKNIAGIGNIQGGALTIKQSNKNILYQLQLRPFANTSYNDRTARGVYALKSPILLRPQELMEAYIELGASTPDKTAVRIELRGTQTSAY